MWREKCEKEGRCRLPHIHRKGEVGRRCSASDRGRIVYKQTENRRTEQANLPSQFSYSPCGKIVAKSCFRPFVSFVVGCCKFTTPKSWTRSSQNRASDRCKHRFAGGCVQHNPSRNCQMLRGRIVSRSFVPGGRVWIIRAAKACFRFG